MQYKTIEEIRKTVVENAERVKQLGAWPSHKKIESLISRIPENGEKSSGFDAGIACALDLIPRDKQRLSAVLHGNYTPDAILQVKNETEGANSKDVSWSFGETETCWWLLGCRFCQEGEQDAKSILQQVNDFRILSKSTYARIEAALNEWKKMQRSFTVVDGIALATQDGGMQAAYINGHSVAIQPMHGIWFVGTYHESLGIPDNFKWCDDKDDQGRSKSGPVFGSKQFVKCANFDELCSILNFARVQLGHL